MRLPWAQSGRLQSFFTFNSTFKFFNNLGNLLFAQSQPKPHQQTGFCHGFATVSFFAWRQTMPPIQQVASLLFAEVTLLGISLKSDLLITKNLRWLQKLQAVHTEVSDINDLGNLLSLKKQLPELKAAGVLTLFWHS